MQISEFFFNLVLHIFIFFYIKKKIAKRKTGLKKYFILCKNVRS